MISVACEHGKDPMCCPHCLLRQNVEQQADLAALRAENERKDKIIAALKALVETSTALARELAVRSGTTYGPAPVLEWVYTLSEQTVANFRAVLAKVEEDGKP
jgi:hypothetical protein